VTEALVRRVPAAGLLLAAAAVAYSQAHRAIHSINPGIDFVRLYHAGTALIHGTSIYADKQFIYPPSAAPVFAPLGALKYATAFDVFTVLSVVAVLAATLLALSPWRSALWATLAALAALAVIKSDALTETIAQGNITLLLAPAAVGVLLLYDARRWQAGTALLVLTLLIKPLLAPLILLPLLRREWRPLLAPLAAGALILIVAFLLVPGADHFGAALRFLGGGASLTGGRAVANVSIAGVASYHHFVAWGWVARLAILAATLAVLYVWARRPASPGSIAAIGALLLATTFLVGPLAENHYMLVLIPCLLAAVALHPRPLLAALAALPALALFAFPTYAVGHILGSWQAAQWRWLATELLAALGAAAAVLLARGPEAARAHDVSRAELAPDQLMAPAARPAAGALR
jgi:arabinofuranan 3-O-arabinosyltransferase